MRASQRDLLSVQKSTEIEGWLALADVQDNADSMAAASSSQELVNVLPFVLMVVTTSGWIEDPLVTTAAAPPFLVPLLADPSFHIVDYEIRNRRDRNESGGRLIEFV